MRSWVAVTLIFSVIIAVLAYYVTLYFIPRYEMSKVEDRIALVAGGKICFDMPPDQHQRFVASCALPPTRFTVLAFTISARDLYIFLAPFQTPTGHCRCLPIIPIISLL